MQNKKQVVVTGMGVVSSLGLDTGTLWGNMLAGKSGIRKITGFDVSGFKTPFGGLVNNDELSNAFSAINLRPVDRTVDMSILASHQALKQAGLNPDTPSPEPQRIAVLFGTGAGSAQSLFTAYSGFSEKGLRGLRPTTVPKAMANAISSQISIRFKLTGPNYVMVSACASSTLAIGNAFRMIRDGYIDQVLCGGGEAGFDPVSYGAWNNLGVTSKNPVPEKACRPFDAERDGCVLGEGAGALLLESLESAQSRNATVLAQIQGFGESSDASHITSPSPEGQATAMRMAIKSAGINPEEIGFINAHGTATEANDLCESQSIRMALGDLTGNIPAASNKSFFGHTLGASGATETIVTIMGLINGKVPPSLNLDNPDPACSLNFVGNTPMEIQTSLAMKNSFGFGGNNSVLIIRKV